MRNSTCKIISDASFDPLTGKCGYGVAIVMNGLTILKHGSIRGAKSSCEAEMLAAKKGLDYLKTKEFSKLGREVKKVAFLSDNFCVTNIDPRNEDKVAGWERSPKQARKRLAKLARGIKDVCEKYPRGYEAFHIKGHTIGANNPKGVCHDKLEYKYNCWCDQSARKNLRYDLRGKQVIHCERFIDADHFSVRVPDGAYAEWRKKNGTVFAVTETE